MLDIYKVLTSPLLMGEKHAYCKRQACSEISQKPQKLAEQ